MATKPSSLHGTHLFFLVIGQDSTPDHPTGAVMTCKPDGSAVQTLISGIGTYPDGIQIDTLTNHVYFTNMGTHASVNDGFITRVDLDGRNSIVAVGEGEAGFTPKQCTLVKDPEDEERRTLYWCDREGMRIWRAKLPGKEEAGTGEKLKPELLYQAAEGEEARKDQRNHCVGIAVNMKTRRIDWTQKGPPKGGKGRLFTASLDIPHNETPSSRSDIVTLMDNLPEPIDLELDHSSGWLYKTDRGAEPRGNTVSRVDLTVFGKETGTAPVVQALESGKVKVEEEILDSHLHEAIGLAFDQRGKKMYFTDLGGSVYSAGMDGKDKKEILNGFGGGLTGITVAHFD